MDKLIADFKKRQPYFGKRLYGGKGQIRIAHTLDRLVCNGFMVAGEAANMVIPLHGSGVSSALYSGCLAAKVASGPLRQGSPGTAELWPYAARYHRSRGAVLAGYNALRLTLESLNHQQVTHLLESGFSGPEDMINSMIPRPLSVTPSSLPRRIICLARRPDLARPLLSAGASIIAIQRHYQGYPRTYSHQKVAAWEKKARRLFSQW